MREPHSSSFILEERETPPLVLLVLLVPLVLGQCAQKF